MKKRRKRINKLKLELFLRGNAQKKNPFFGYGKGLFIGEPVGSGIAFTCE